MTSGSWKATSVASLTARRRRKAPALSARERAEEKNHEWSTVSSRMVQCDLAPYSQPSLAGDNLFRYSAAGFIAPAPRPGAGPLSGLVGGLDKVRTSLGRRPSGTE